MSDAEGGGASDGCGAPAGWENRSCDRSGDSGGSSSDEDSGEEAELEPAVDKEGRSASAGLLHSRADVVDDLRRSWLFASVVHFCNAFKVSRKGARAHLLVVHCRRTTPLQLGTIIAGNPGPPRLYRRRPPRAILALSRRASHVPGAAALEAGGARRGDKHGRGWVGRACEACVGVGVARVCGGRRHVWQVSRIGARTGAVSEKAMREWLWRIHRGALAGPSMAALSSRHHSPTLALHPRRYADLSPGERCLVLHVLCEHLAGTDPAVGRALARDRRATVSGPPSSRASSRRESDAPRLSTKERSGEGPAPGPAESVRSDVSEAGGAAPVLPAPLGEDAAGRLYYHLGPNECWVFRVDPGGRRGRRRAVGAAGGAAVGTVEVVCTDAEGCRAVGRALEGRESRERALKELLEGPLSDWLEVVGRDVERRAGRDVVNEAGPSKRSGRLARIQAEAEAKRRAEEVRGMRSTTAINLSGVVGAWLVGPCTLAETAAGEGAVSWTMLPCCVPTSHQVFSVAVVIISVVSIYRIFHPQERWEAECRRRREEEEGRQTREREERLRLREAERARRLAEEAEWERRMAEEQRR